VSACLWIPKNVTVICNILFCFLELVILVIFKSREWTSVVVWISKQEIRAMLLLSRPDNLEGIAPLEDSINP